MAPDSELGHSWAQEWGEVQQGPSRVRVGWSQAQGYTEVRLRDGRSDVGCRESAKGQGACSEQGASGGVIGENGDQGSDQVETRARAWMGSVQHQRGQGSGRNAQS